ncbi:alpha/beta hydrolase [Actinokineospora sp. PR83]|uniref:alpha/beta hydrolase n=1 Tax=Actinokineospora sp. PR83 TaxID=2884908 RepID=UPI001F40419F|nr:alpha/beta hydrolase [Actinokineospora sp. PR83]MCG8920024.1 alpha/beta hydrolase [Actinokineospora sp. PR83]
MRVGRLAAVALLVAGTVAGVAPQALAAPEVLWHGCAELDGVPEADRGRFDCAEYAVPLDHDHPGAGTVTIAMMRRAADDRDARIGSLFLNPGGPGASGYLMAASAPVFLEPEVLRRFDVIGFDPRGVGRSTPLRCFTSQEEADGVFANVVSVPVTPEQVREAITANRTYEQSCGRNGGTLLDHMSTADVARDLDLVRAAVGDPALNYLGFSYGTLLGATYAAMFPDRTRAVVLDGNVDPALRTTDGLEHDRRRTAGFELALDAYLRTCDEVGCPLAPDSRAKFDATRDALEHSGPVTLPSGYTISRDDLVTTTAGALYRPALFTRLAVFFAATYAATHPGRSAPTPLTADTLRDLTAARIDPRRDSPYTDDDAYAAVNCADKPFPVPLSLVPRIAEWWDAEMPTFGRGLSWGDPATCADWPGRGSDRFTGPWNARTPNPVLVVGNRYDPATRHRFAEAMAAQLGNAHLLTVDAFGHCILGSSACADRAVAEYLVDLRLPEPGRVCEPDVAPFAAF